MVICCFASARTGVMAWVEAEWAGNYKIRGVLDLIGHHLTRRKTSSGSRGAGLRVICELPHPGMLFEPSSRIDGSVRE